MRLFKLMTALLVVMTIGTSFVSCDEDIDKSNRYTFTGETMADFLLNRSDRFSKIISIYEQADMMGLLSTYGRYTLFLPGDSAIDRYLMNQFLAWDSTKNDPVPTWTGVISPYFEDLMNPQATEDFTQEQAKAIADSMAIIIAKTHLVPYDYEMVDMSEGVLDTRNYNNRYLGVSFSTDTVTERFRILINNRSGIIEGDNLVENGVVHVVDEAVAPSSNTVPKLIDDQPYFSIFSAALQETGFDSKLQDYELKLNGEKYELGTATCPAWDTSKGLAGYPRTYNIKYTAFVETDDVYAANGIRNLDDLKAFAEKWYGTEDRNDPESPENALYKFVAYHILDRELNYNFIVQFGLDHPTYNSESSTRGFVAGVDRLDYYETMLGTLVKACKPLSSDVVEESQNLYLNYSHKGLKNPDMRNHLNVKIYDVTTFTKMDEKYAHFEQSALNGIVHPIDKILVYDEDEMKGNVLNERMRFDVASLLPELASNGVRYCRWEEAFVKGGSYGDFRVPDGYCKNIQFYEPTTEWHYFPPYSWGANYLGDEIIVVGQYDFAYRLPPVPEGTYELRMGYTATSLRAITQFYVDGKVTGIPVDLRIGAMDDRIGWIADNDTEDDGVDNDKVMRNHGYMKGPASYNCQYKDGLVRDHDGAIRIIITQKQFGGGDHWLRMKKVDSDWSEFNHDYFELVPKGIVTSHIPEDRY